jgi:hypothetical protein
MDKDDRLIPLTRIAFTPLALFTAIFGPLLVIFPGATDVFWSWPVKPEMSAVWIGAGYTFGGLAITTMLVVGRWSASAVAVLGTWPFSIAVLAATLLHLDRFFVDSPRFYIWMVIYLGLPVVLPAMFWLNRRRDPGPRPTDVMLPSVVRTALVVAGVPLLLLGLVLFLAPSMAAGFWPWQLTLLMSRVVGAWLTFIGTGALCALFERRYIAFRYFLPPAACWFTILLVGSLFHLGDFQTSRPSVIIYFAALMVAILAIIAVFLIMERHYRAQAAGEAAPAF